MLSGEAADATAMYMFLLLFRQLVFSEPDPCDCERDQSCRAVVTDAQLGALKKEIRDISSGHLGFCFKQVEDGSGSGDGEKWAKVRQDIVLQIAMRAKEARSSSSGSTRSLESSRISGSASDSGSDPQPQSRVPASAPDERMLKLAERWSETNMRPGSPLSTLLRKRIRDVVFNQVVALTFPSASSRDSSRDSVIGTSMGKPLDFASVAPPSALSSGMEPLADEIRLLSERLSRLAHIHLGVYLPLYEQEDFSLSVFSDSEPGSESCS